MHDATRPIELSPAPAATSWDLTAQPSSGASGPTG